MYNIIKNTSLVQVRFQFHFYFFIAREAFISELQLRKSVAHTDSVAKLNDNN